MKTADHLKTGLSRIDSKGYKAYQDITGQYHFGNYSLSIDHIQRDPFAPPTRVRVSIPLNISAFPSDTFHTRIRQIALRDYLTRIFYIATQRYGKGIQGTGNSGIISIDCPGQEILDRTSVLCSKQEIEARFAMGLPATGRTIAGKQAILMFFEQLPKIVHSSLHYASLNQKELYSFIRSAEDTEALRGQLQDANLVAFIADGAILPRTSGIDQRPLSSEKAILFRSPDSLRVEMETPNQGKITGLGIPKGINLIVGGGYHGKSTLLKALAQGIYNHIPGDGRELVVVDPKAMKIRSEDGRRIENVDISPFITNVPFGGDTTAFSTDDASGSTSQAANIIEAIEADAQVLLIDEDTSATNFMIRDHRMQELVSKDKEPITPFIDKVRQLYQDLGVSTILVLGGSGDYFDVADHVICMIDYQPYDLTAQAHKIARNHQLERKPEGGTSFGKITQRIPLAQSFSPRKGKQPIKINSGGLHSIAFGTSIIDLGAVEQLAHTSQTNAIGDAIHYATRHMDGSRSLGEILRDVKHDIDEKGLDVLSSGRTRGDYAHFRELELAAAINRLRTLKTNKKGEGFN